MSRNREFLGPSRHAQNICVVVKGGAMLNYFVDVRFKQTKGNQIVSYSNGVKN